MTEAVKPPIVPAKEPPINEGVQARLRHLREVIGLFSVELAALQKLEAALIASAERLERHTSLIGMETQLLEALLKRDSKPWVDPRAQPGSEGSYKLQPASVVSIVDRVEADLQSLIVDARAEKAS